MEQKHKAKADEVLLSRGKSGWVRIDANGKTVDQVLSNLLNLTQK